jgi:hypothetical protein
MRRFSIPLSLGGDPSLISALGMGRTVLKQNVAVLHAFWPRIISSGLTLRFEAARASNSRGPSLISMFKLKKWTSSIYRLTALERSMWFCS